MIPNEPIWLAHARKYIGLKEVPGPKSNPTILAWLKSLKAWWAEDATPWCGTFVAHCMQESKIVLPKHWYRAKDWLNWGVSVPLSAPTLGCIAVLGREGGGHVFIVTKQNATYVWGVGGNQSDGVNEAKFLKSRVLGYRWPKNTAPGVVAPTVKDDGKPVSKNEA